LGTQIRPGRMATRARGNKSTTWMGENREASESQMPMLLRPHVLHYPPSSTRKGVPVRGIGRSSSPPYPQSGRVSLSGVLILTRSYPRLLPCFLQGPILVLVLDLPFLRGYLLSLFFNEVISSPCFLMRLSPLPVFNEIISSPCFLMRLSPLPIF
jgi:hypothetical protein